MTQDHSRPQEQNMNAEAIASAFAERLSTAREAAGHSVAIIAQRLRISSSKIGLLESGQWDSAGPDVYVRGYLMAYCRLLEVDTAEVVLYFRCRQAENQARAAEVVARPPSRPEFARYQRAAGYAAATLLIGPAIVFWVAQGFGGANEQVATEAPAQVSQGTSLVVEESQEPAANGPQPVMASMATVPESLSRDPEVSAQTVVEFESASDAPSGWLQLEFKEDVWLEVSDHNGKRLDYGLVSASSQRRFSIARGLNIRLGNADTVVARVDGEVLDLQPYINHQDVASFTLPLTEPQQPQSQPLPD